MAKIQDKKPNTRNRIKKSIHVFCEFFNLEIQLGLTLFFFQTAKRFLACITCTSFSPLPVKARCPINYPRISGGSLASFSYFAKTHTFQTMRTSLHKTGVNIVPSAPFFP